MPAALARSEPALPTPAARGARSCVSIRLYFFSLLYSVGRYTPRMLAALRLLPRVRSSVCRIASFSISSSVWCGGMTKPV